MANHSSILAWEILWTEEPEIYIYIYTHTHTHTHIYITSLSMHMLIDTGCFHTLAIVIMLLWTLRCTQISVFSFFVYIPNNEIPESFGSYIFSFPGNSILFSTVSALIYILINTACKCTLSCTSSPTVTVLFLVIAVLRVVRWYLNVL